ncbi:putative Glycos_transf_1 domain-containing protein [Vibrio owensii]|uniref:Glycos_transf_1 domain-containing protein n=1 Tax=Vibrio owensii TaxID=696485 RepID=A0AAU9Q991_9VIBR|nr:putative Glycos_transf_1 domain-containing protein [Vibrio owensii]
MQKYLLVGPRLSNKNKDIGGTTILMDLFDDYLNENKFEYHVVATNKYKNQIANLFYVIFHVAVNVRKFDVVIGNAAINFLKYISPILLIITKLSNKKYVLRKFGGNLDRQYDDASFLAKKSFDFTFKYSDLIFVETKMIQQYLRSKTSRDIHLFPNNRKSSVDSPKVKNNNKYVFISQIKKEKGINEVFAANKFLKNKIYSFGPIHDNDIELDEYYLGVVKPTDVPSILNNSSLLILPTYWEGEGYPGIILEALASGVPVISTNYRAIPEIIDDKKSGILLDNGNYEELLAAISYIENESNFNILSKNALRQFRLNFETNMVHKNVLEVLEKVCLDIN